MKRESSTVKSGEKYHDFLLPDAITKDLYTFKDIKGELGTVVMFISNHCPYVKLVASELVRIANDYRILGFGFLAVSSNDATQYPEDSFYNMWQFARKHNFTFPYLYDETQAIARAYQAVCTPDFYIYNASAELVYHGQLDDARPQNGIAVNGRNVREVLDALFNSRSIPKPQKPSVGCSIKWKKEKSHS